MKLKLITLFLFFQIMTGVANSQIFYNYSGSYMYHSNVFFNTDNNFDSIYLLNGYIGKNFSPAGINTRLYYEGSSFQFDKYSLKSFYHHKSGAAFSKGLANGNVLFGGVSFSQKLGKDEYSSFNYDQTTAYFNSKISAVKGLKITPGVYFKHRSYDEIPEFSYNSPNAFLQVTKSLKSRTTIWGELRWRMKDFIEDQSSYFVLHKNDPVYGGGMGSGGPGSGGGGMGGGPGGGHGGGMGGPVITDSTEVIFNNTPLQQILVNFRVAQSLNETTGISLNYTYQWNLEDNEREFTGNRSNYSEEDELFDDVFLYEGQRFNFEFTKLISESANFKIAYTYAEKEYGSPIDIFNPEENITTRNDIYRNFEISFEKYIGVFVGESEVSGFASWTQTKNSSNKLLNLYEINTLWLGLYFSN